MLDRTYVISTYPSLSYSDALLAQWLSIRTSSRMLIGSIPVTEEGPGFLPCIPASL